MKRRRDRNYVDGRNIRLEVLNANGVQVLLAEKAAELVRSQADIIVVFQTPAALAAQQATGEIPIVMGQVGDPVASGLVASLARPGGNITGLAGGAAEVIGKVVELTRELLPNARRVAALANGSDPFAKLFLEGVSSGARQGGYGRGVVCAATRRAPRTRIRNDDAETNRCRDHNDKHLQKGGC